MHPYYSKFVSELSKLRPSSTFLSLKGYRNEHSEVSDYSIVFNISYKNSIKKSIMALEGCVPKNDLAAKAKQELIDSFNLSLNKIKEFGFEELQEHYTHFTDEKGVYIKGVKLHDKTATIHLYGFVVHKKVIVPGNYPISNKRPLTIEKDKLRKLCPVSKFRQFKVSPEQLDYISVNNLVLLP